MRLLLLCSLALLLASPVLAQQYTWEWAGVTSIDFLGDGNGGGFVAMTEQCRADFGLGARMCK